MPPSLLLPTAAAMGPGSRFAVFQARRSPATLLREHLQPLQFTLKDWRAVHVKAVDFEHELQRVTKQMHLTGRWKKDTSASDPMDEACDLVELPWLFRKAVNVLDTLEVTDTSEYFETNLKAGGIMDVVERYPWTGEPVRHGRRDKRRGHHTAYVTRTEEGPCIVCTWEDPYGGDCVDTFTLSDCGNVLTQSTSMTIRSSGRSTQYKSVFRRQHQ